MLLSLISPAHLFTLYVEMATQTVMAKLTKGEKLDGKNYDIWRCKIQCLLNEQEVLTTLEQVMVEPEQGNTS